jgi:hypothetical protein
MSAKKKTTDGINIKNSTVKVGGDIVGRDKITYTSSKNVAGNFYEAMRLWQVNINREVEKKDIPSAEKQDIQNQIELIKSAIVDEEGKNPSRIEKLINTLAIMSPDIFDVAIATLANPLAGVGLVIRKISDKAKIEAHVDKTAA